MTSEVMDSLFPFSDTAGVANDRRGGNKMKKSVFSRWFAVLVSFSALVWWASVSLRAAAPMGKGESVSAGDAADIETVTKVERDMGDAMVAVDIDKLSQIYADDWASVSGGKIMTKVGVLDYIKSGKNKLVSYEFGPMDVQVVGDVAVAQGRVSEKRIRDGKDVAGEGVYMDLLKKRAGKWEVVRSAGAMKSGN
jgi:ketosteroid isomerase-like protein